MVRCPIQRNQQIFHLVMVTDVIWLLLSDLLYSDAVALAA